MVTTAEQVCLRSVHPNDLLLMYDLQLDQKSNRMAVTIPRTQEAFDAHWARSLKDSKISARAIILRDAFVGYISRFQVGCQDHVGYWINRAFWGKGITSRALQLLLEEVTQHPLVATVATSNAASLRILQKHGFLLERIYLAPASERYPECEEAVLVLADCEVPAMVAETVENNERVLK